MSDEMRDEPIEVEEAEETMPTGLTDEGETYPVGAFVVTENGDIYRQPTPDSGFYGAGSNRGAGNDNRARWTTPGFQKDKWERGPLMPR